MPNFHLGDLTIGLLLDVSKFNAMNATVIGNASRLMLVGSAVQNLGNKVEQLGSAFTKTFTLPVAAGIGLGINEFRKFDAQLNNSYAIMDGITDQQRKMMAEVAKGVAGNSSIALDDIAGGYYNIASAGYEAEGAMKALAVVERFATAGNFSLANATEYLTTAQAALGQKTGDAVKDMKSLKTISDVLTKADSAATGSTEQFAKAMTTKSAAAAKLLGKDIYELTAVLMAYSDQGVRAQQGGEKTYSLWRDLQRSAIKQSDAWKTLGVSVYDGNQRMRHTADILDDLNAKMEKMTPMAQRQLLLDLKIPDRSVAGVQMLLGLHDKIRENEKTLRAASVGAGNTIRQAEEREKAFEKQMQRLWNNIKLVALEIGETLVPAIRWMADALMGAIKWWQKLDDSFKVVIGTTVALVAAIGPLLVVFGTLVSVLGKVVFGFGFLQMAMGALGTSSGIAGVAAFKTTLASIPGLSMLATTAVRGLTLALGVGLVIAAWKAGKAISNMYSSVRDFNRELQRSKDLDQQRIDIIVKKNETTLRKIENGDPDVKIGQVQDNSIRDLAMYKNAVKAADAEVKRLEGSWRNLFGDSKPLVAAKQELETKKELLAIHEDYHSKLIDTFTALADKKTPQMLADDEEAELQEKLAEKAKELTDQLALEAATLGMTSRQAQLYAASMELVDKSQLDAARSLAEWLDEQDAQNAIDEVTKSLQMQAATIGMSAGELAVYKATMDGATAAQIAQIQAAATALDLAEQKNKMDKEAQSLIEKYDTPQNKFLKRQKELDEMLANNSITMDVYNNALEDARKELNKDFVVKFKVQGIDAVEAGTAEALALIQEYLNRANGAVGAGTKLPGPNNPAIAGAGAGVPPIGAVPANVPPAFNGPATAQIPAPPKDVVASAEIPKNVFRYDRKNPTKEQRDILDRHDQRRLDRIPFEQAVDEFNTEKALKSRANAAKDKSRARGVYFEDRERSPEQLRSTFGRQSPGVHSKETLDSIGKVDMQVTEHLLTQIAETLKDISSKNVLVDAANIDDTN